MLREMTVLQFLLHLELRREHKKDYMKMEKAKWGLDYRTINKIMCSLESGCTSKGSEK